MKRFKNEIIRMLLILSLFSFSLIYSKSKEKEYFYHHLRIKYDFSNIRNENAKLKKELVLAGNFLSSLIYSNNNKPISFTLDSLYKCDESIGNIHVSSYSYQNIDVLIIPYMIRMRSSFQGLLCHAKNLKVSDLAILEISSKNAIKEMNDDIDLFRLNLLNALTNVLGFRRTLLMDLSISNSYFIVPEYTTDKLIYSKTIKKYYKFSNIEMPEININPNIRSSYLSYWPKKIKVPDYMNEKIDNTYSVTELTMNLLKELNFFRINKCDFELFNNEHCFRFDQKCFSSDDLLNNYFIEYHYILNDTSKLDMYDLTVNQIQNIKCHLSTKTNLKNKQCGVIEGELINDYLQDKYCINYGLSPKLKTNENKFDIPELKNITSQKLKLVSPSKLCPKKHPRTVFFSPLHFATEGNKKGLDDRLIKSLKEHEDKERRKFKIEEVTITDKKYFVTFISYTRYLLFVQTLEGNGLIRSYLHNGNHNMLAVPPSKFNGKLLQKYQLFYKRSGNYMISNKNNLHYSFQMMQMEFPRDYDYMTETYSYPESKKKILQKFQNYKPKKGNLWLIKPKNSSEGKGIHIFKGLKYEAGSYLLTKYIENPHLLNGKKYDFRIYVLITAMHPLSIYVYQQGLVRIASDKYSLDLDKITDKYIHLTNTVVNKKNSEYIFNDSIDSELGNKWSLQAYRNYCKRNGIDFGKIFSQIHDKVIKTILSIEPTLSEMPKGYENSSDTIYHNLFGFDFILDDQFKVYLLEVNDGPSLGLYDNMDKDIKTKLVADIFNLVGIVPFSHDEKQKPLDEVYEYTDKIEEAVDYALCEYSRPKGYWQRVFPLKNNIGTYKKLFKHISKENIEMWERLEDLDI